MKRPLTLLSAILLTVSAGGQIVLALLLYNPAGSALLETAGWGVLWLSAVFGWLPIFTLRRHGGVPGGKAYVHTTRLVKRGVYGIVRHPQYLAGVLLAVALPLIARHWLVALPGAAAIFIYYHDTFAEESACVRKFGDDYRRYMERVPRLNFAAGIVRRLRERKERKTNGH